MNTPAKIEFDPSLFGDQPPSELKSAPYVPIRRRFRVAGILMMATAVLAIPVALFGLTRPNNKPTFLNDLPIASTFQTEHASSAPEPVGAPSGRYVDSAAACEGSEFMCSTAVTHTPATALRKIASGLSSEKETLYRVTVSITAIEKDEKAGE